MCLLSPTCVAIGANIIANFEQQGIGLTSSTASLQPKEGDSLTFQRVLGLLFLDSIIYSLITWSVLNLTSLCTLMINLMCRYVDAVFPGQYGVPQKPLFFLTKTYWFGSKSSSQNKSSLAACPSPKVGSMGLSLSQIDLTKSVTLHIIDVEMATSTSSVAQPGSAPRRINADDFEADPTV